MQPLSYFAARQSEIAELCRTYGVRQLRLFGSAARTDFDPEQSDFDFLVDFGPAIGRNRFQQFIRFKLELERLVERPIDLVPTSSLRDPRVRAAAESGALQLHAA
jgi:predicted nucleotidyltransferase